MSAATAMYTVRTTRGPNQVLAQPQRIQSANGHRWACGRNVKGESPRGRGYFEIVEVWTLKERRCDRSIHVVGTRRTRAEAEAFIAGGAR